MALKDQKQIKAEKRAAALRENLKKRKALAAQNKQDSNKDIEQDAKS